MKSSKNTISVTVLTFALFAIIAGFSQCGCGTVRHADSRKPLQNPNNQADVIATKSGLGLVKSGLVPGQFCPVPSKCLPFFF